MNIIHKQLQQRCLNIDCASLNKRISIEKNLWTLDDLGCIAPNWQIALTVWGSLEEISYIRYTEHHALRSDLMFVAIFRYSKLLSEITRKYRLPNLRLEFNKSTLVPEYLAPSKNKEYLIMQVRKTL